MILINNDSKGILVIAIENMAMGYDYKKYLIIEIQLPPITIKFATTPYNLIPTLLPTVLQGSTEHVDARARVLRRGDNVKIHSSCNEIESGYSVLLFLSQLSDKNDYGEILFFQDVSVS